MSSAAHANREARRAAARQQRRDGSPLRGRVAGASGAILTLSGLLVSLAGPASADEYVVNSSTDTVADDGTTTLREAVVAANLRPGPDTIRFAPDVTVIALALGQIDITDSLAIAGPGRDALAVDAGDASRIFYVRDQDAVLDVTISGLTMRNGRSAADQAGGALVSRGADLTLDGVAVLDSFAGTNGGGVAFEGLNAGRLRVTNSLVSGNEADTERTTRGTGAVGRGGGISVTSATGTVAISGTQVSGNESRFDGGGVHLTLSSPASATLQASTITGNTSGGTAFDESRTRPSYYGGPGRTYRYAGTTGGSGAGLFVQGGDTTSAPSVGGGPRQGTLTVAGSSVTGNTAERSERAPDARNDYTNYDSGNGGGLDSGNLRAVTISGSAFSGNAAGQGLYGGGTGGGARVRDVDGIDVRSSAFGATGAGDTAVPGNTAGGGAGGLYVGSADRATVTGVTVSGNTSGRSGGGIASFYVRELTVSDSTIADNVSRRDGGGALLYSELGRVTVTGTTISRNSAGDQGGGLYLGGDGDTTVQSVTVTGNVAGAADSPGGSGSGDGGGAYVGDDADVTVADSSFTGNRAGTPSAPVDGVVSPGSGDGGGVSVDDSARLALSRTVVSGNVAAVDGGGLAVQNRARLVMSGTDVSHNAAGQDGGGVAFEQAFLSAVDSTTVDANTAGGDGAGLHLYDTDLPVTRTTISNNVAQGDGGGVFVEAGEVPITNSTLSGNRTGTGEIGEGGGLFVGTGGRTPLDLTTIVDNDAAEGVGGIYGSSGDVISIRNSIVANNADGDIGSGGGPAPAPEPQPEVPSTFAVEFSLVEDRRGEPLNGSGNLEVDPRLGALSDNGGPTLTHRPLASSPALDAGDPAATLPATDQRGAERLLNGRVDMGSVEVGNAPVVTQDPQSQTVPPGEPVTFTVAATGSPTPTVQHQVSRDGGTTFVDIVGATSTTYTFTAGRADNGARYRAVFTNRDGTATTAAAVLTVPAPVQPEPQPQPPAPQPPAPAPPTTSPTTSPTVTPTTSAPTTPASPTTAPTQGRYTGLAAPVRVLDSRSGTGTSTGLKTGRVVLDLSTALPAGSTSVVLNVTATNGQGNGNVVAYPDGTAKPATSNLNYRRGGTQANEVLVLVPASRRVVLEVDGGATNLVADLVGFFGETGQAAGGRVTPRTPVRALDTRSTDQPTRRGEVVLDLSSLLPAGSTGAVLNVTVTRASGAGFVVAYPTGVAKPGTSNVNYAAGETRANEVFTQVGTGANAGKVSLFVDGAAASVVVDLVGAIGVDGAAAGDLLALGTPVRALDTRTSSGAVRGLQGGTFDLQLPTQVPASAVGVVLNVTAVGADRAGFLTVFPTGQTAPSTSNVNFVTGAAQANEVLVPIGSNRSVSVLVGGGGGPRSHVIVDVVGYVTR